MKILFSKTSPYSSKVRMAAVHAGIDCEEVSVSTDQMPEVLVSNNPLGKIPVLIEDDGRAIFDSRAIMAHFNRLSGGKLYPRNNERRTEAEVLEALCDGITDSLIAIVYERRYRPEETLHQPWIDRHWQKVSRGLDHLEKNLPKLGRSLHGGHFALAALLAYLDLRFEGQWQKGRPKLKRWPAKFETRFERYQAMKPQT